MRRRQPLASLLLATILAAGFSVVWVVVGSYLRHSLIPFHQTRDYLYFMSDGTPLLACFSRGLCFYKDIHGVPVDLDWDHKRLAEAALPADVVRTKQAWFLSQTKPWSERLHSFCDTRSSPAYWYLIQSGLPNGSAYFAGFGAFNREHMGYLAATGFSTTPPPEKDRFPLGVGSEQRAKDTFGRVGHVFPNFSGYLRRGFDATTLFLVGDDHRLYEVNLNDRGVRKLLGDETVLSVGYTFFPIGDRQEAQVVRTERELLVLAGRNEIERRYTLPAEVRKQNIQWSEISPGAAIAVAHDPPNLLDDTRAAHAYWFDAAGEVTRRETVVLARGEATDPTLCLATPTPLGQAIVCGLLYPSSLLADGKTENWREAIRISWLLLGWPIPPTMAVSLVLAIACYRREAHYTASFRQRAAWTTFVFLLGLPGWIGYRFGRRWPAVEECPACRRAIPRSDSHCPRCHAELPCPAPLGIEIMAGSA